MTKLCDIDILTTYLSLCLSVDHTRVKLTLTTAKNDSEYINASFIEVN